MIISKQKPFEEILNFLKGKDKIFITGCSLCATSCMTGGQQQIDEMKTSLKNTANRNRNHSRAVLSQIAGSNSQKQKGRTSVPMRFYAWPAEICPDGQLLRKPNLPMNPVVKRKESRGLQSLRPVRTWMDCRHLPHNKVRQELAKWPMRWSNKRQMRGGSRQ